DVDPRLSQPDHEQEVLRQAIYRNVEPGHEFGPQREGRGDLRIAFGLRHQRAVDAKADLQPLFLRLDMHVGGIDLHRVLEDRLQQLYDRRVLGPQPGAQRTEVDIPFAHIALEFLGQPADLSGAAIDPVDGLQQERLADHRTFNIAPQQT